MSKWLRVSAKNPCAICGKTDWCTFGEDASCCMRIQSDKSASNGGWIHASSSANSEKAKAELMKPIEEPKERINWDMLMADYSLNTIDQDLEEYAKSLGVDYLAIDALQARRKDTDTWAWPMRNGSGDVCGIRLRSKNMKWAIKGSSAGLFIPQIDPPKVDYCIICEGPTDTAAALSLGYWSIGRPSCLGCHEVVKHTIMRYGFKRVVLFSDNDTPKEKPNGGVFTPGQDGAQKLAESLNMPYCIIIPHAKDIRAWLAHGITRLEIDAMIKAKGFTK